jgi:uncharacterized protein YuzE
MGGALASGFAIAELHHQSGPDHTPVVESEEVSNGVVLDFDADGRIVAIELLDATKHVAAGAQFPSAAE